MDKVPLKVRYLDKIQTCLLAIIVELKVYIISEINFIKTSEHESSAGHLCPDTCVQLTMTVMDMSSEGGFSWVIKFSTRYIQRDIKY